MGLKTWIINWLGIHEIITKLFHELVKKIEFDIPTTKSNSRPNLQYPDISELDYVYHTFKFTSVFKSPNSSLIIKLDNFQGLYTDFRFKNQANHRLAVWASGNSWLDACNVLGPLGLTASLENGISCLDIYKSTKESRHCILRPIIDMTRPVYVRIGIPLELESEYPDCIGDITVFAIEN